MKALYIIAWMGLVLSVVVHVMSIFVPEDFFSCIDEFVWILHGGAILLGLPLVVCSQKITIGTKEESFWSAVLEYCPSWMKGMVAIFVLYGIMNFVLFIAIGTESSGNDTPASVFRGFSGHWMIFYSIEVAVFCSYLRKCSASLNNPSNEHGLPTNENFCQQDNLNSTFTKAILLKQFLRFIKAFFIAGSVFVILVWLALKGYPWYLGVFMISLCTFGIINILYLVFHAFRMNLYLKKNHHLLWEKRKSSSFADRVESQKLIIEIDDPHFKLLNLHQKNFSTMCFWVWLVFIVIAFGVLAIIQQI